MTDRPRVADDFDAIRSRLAEICKRAWHDDDGSAAPDYSLYSSRSAVNYEGFTVWCTAIEKFNNRPRCHNGGGGAACCRNAPAAPVADASIS